MSYRLSIGGAAGGELVTSQTETLLATATRHHWRVVAGCRNGNCLSCRAELVAGHACDLQGLTVEPGPILACQTIPRGDMHLLWPGASAPGSASAARTFGCRLLASDASGNAWRSRLELPAGRLPELLPGQWLVVSDRDNYRSDRKLWVISGAAGGARRELLVLSDMALTEPRLALRGPFGACWLDSDTPAPLHVLAGTGRALQARALGEACSALGLARSERAPASVFALTDDGLQRARWREQWGSRVACYFDDDCWSCGAGSPVTRPLAP